jgi:hypothetical protein
MNGAAWPDWTRRIQASTLVFSSAKAAGIVRVAPPGGVGRDAEPPAQLGIARVEEHRSRVKR